MTTITIEPETTVLSTTESHKALHTVCCINDTLALCGTTCVGEWGNSIDEVDCIVCVELVENNPYSCELVCPLKRKNS